MSKWTRFMDMHSGGGQKEDFAYLLIEAPRDEAVVIFYNRFGHNPERVTCACCGEDYSISEHDSIADATAYDRNLPWAEDARGWLYGKDRPADYNEGRYLEPGEQMPEGMRVENTRFSRGDVVPLDEFIADPKAFGYAIITAAEVKPGERSGTVPEQGYVWHD